MIENHYDLTVIGGGPSGSAAAIACLNKNPDVRILVVEKCSFPREKPCGGVLTPACLDFLLEELDLELPESVFYSPEALGLHYTPPSGWGHGGSIDNYTLRNIRRDLFDEWLAKEASRKGAEFLYQTDFLHLLIQKDDFKVHLKKGPYSICFNSEVVIGADGSKSVVRKEIMGRLQKWRIRILQKEFALQETGIPIEPYFYIFFGRTRSETYQYLIPKDQRILIGTGSFVGTFPRSSPQISPKRSLNSFIRLLKEIFEVNLRKPTKSEAWTIPVGTPSAGSGNGLLVGDAGGFCNAFTGEGVRFALESGWIAGECCATFFKDTNRKFGYLASVYGKEIAPLSRFLEKMTKFALEATDEDLETFVKDSLNRRVHS